MIKKFLTVLLAIVFVSGTSNPAAAVRNWSAGAHNKGHISRLMYKKRKTNTGYKKHWSGSRNIPLHPHKKGSSPES